MNKLIGRFSDMTNHDYHLAPAISSSALIKFIEKSPRHYKSYLEREREETDAMRHGTAIHHAVLEPETFESRYTQKPEGMSFATKDGKAWREENKDKEILTFEQYETCRGIRQSIYNDEITKAIFSKGSAEHSFFWIDDETGVHCKCRPDWLIENPTAEQIETISGFLPESLVETINGETIFIVDLKSSEDASPRGFINSLNRYRFDVPERFYTTGICTHFKTDNVIFLFLMVEKFAPFTPVIYLAGRETCVRAEGKIREAITGIKYCQENNYWPGYNHGRVLESDYFLQKEQL